MHYRGKYWPYSGNRHYSEYPLDSLFPSVPSDFTGTVAGNRHYSNRHYRGTTREFTGTVAGNQHYSTGTMERLVKYAVLSVGAPRGVTDAGIFSLVTPFRLD